MRDDEARELLAGATEALLESPGDVAARRIAELAIGRLADWCGVELVDGDGRSQLVASAGADSGASNGTSSMTIPLLVCERLLGTITFVSTAGDDVYGDPELGLARELARRVAVAVDGASLHRAELEAKSAAARSRERTLRLQAVTEALGAALTQAEVAEVVIDAGVAALDAGGCLVYGVEGAELVLLGASGVPPHLAEAWRRVPIDASHPAAEAARRHAPIVLDSSDSLVAVYPELEAARVLGDVSLLSVPVHLGSRVTGVLSFAFSPSHVVGDEEQGLAITVARQCAQALERARLYEAERRARSDAERAAARTERLHELTAALAQAASVAETADVLLRETMRALDASAGWVSFLTEDGRELEHVVSTGYPERVVAAYYRIPRDASVPSVEAIASGTPLWFDTATDLGTRFPELLADHAELGLEALAVLPIRRGRQPIGFLALAFSEARGFGLADRVLILTMLRQCELALERARLYEHERNVAETLQRSMLPQRLPNPAGASLAARYLSGSEGLYVGGDWYDVIELPEGRLGLAVGDVAGKGVPAASTMGRLSQALRIYASEGRKPRAVLRRLNELVDEATESFATLVFLVVDLDSGDSRYANAGHLPPLVRRRSGETEVLTRPTGLPLGIGPTTYRHEVLVLEPGDLLLLYTDGLVERRDRPLDNGLQALVEAVAAGPAEPEALLDRIVEQLVGDRPEDDVALLALRFG